MTEGSESIPRSNGTGSRRPQNIRIRIRLEEIYIGTALSTLAAEKAGTNRHGKLKDTPPPRIGGLYIQTSVPDP
jgi:hypothetical protein